MKPARITLILSLLLNLAGGFYFLRQGGCFILKDRLSGPNALWHEYRQSPYQQGRVSVHVALSEAQPGPKLVFIGDSITEHCDWAELAGPSAINRGIAGDEVAGVAARIDGILSAKPRRIFLMIDINNLLRGDSSASVIAAYQSLASRIKDSQTPLVIESILPVGLMATAPAGIGIRIIEVNRALAGLADHQRVVFLDLHSQFTDPSGHLSSDFTRDGRILARWDVTRSAPTGRRSFLLCAAPSSFGEWASAEKKNNHT